RPLARRSLRPGEKGELELALFRCYQPGPVTLAELVAVAGARWAVEDCFAEANVCASHCVLFSLWFLEQSRLAGFDLDTQAASPAVPDVDGGELAAVGLMQNGLVGHAARGGRLVQRASAVGRLPGGLGAPLGR